METNQGTKVNFLKTQTAEEARWKKCKTHVKKETKKITLNALTQLYTCLKHV